MHTTATCQDVLPKEALNHNRILLHLPCRNQITQQCLVVTAAQNLKEHLVQANDHLVDPPPEILHKAPIISRAVQGVLSQANSRHRALTWALDTQIVRLVNG
jgi:hypothetical protein